MKIETIEKAIRKLEHAEQVAIDYRESTRLIVIRAKLQKLYAKLEGK